MGRCEKAGTRQNESAAAPNCSVQFFPVNTSRYAPGGKLLAEDDFGITPGFLADGKADLGVELTEETSHQHQQRGFAEGAGERDDMLVSASHGAQRHVTSLGKQRAVIAAEAQRRTRYIKFQAAIAWARRRGDLPVRQDSLTRRPAAGPAEFAVDGSSPAGDCQDRRD